MKKMRIFAMLLALCVLLSIPAMAADKATLTVVEGTGATATFNAENPDIIEVTVTSKSLIPGEQYAVLMLKSADGSIPEITEDNASDILYIDQMAATGTGNGTVKFNVYPSTLATSVIVITGIDGGPVKVVIVEGKYVLGDVNDDGAVNIGDAVMVLHYSVGLVTEDRLNINAANVNNDTVVNIGDAVKLLQYAVGILDTL